MGLVCFDTQVLIWGIQGHARITQQHMIVRTKNFIRHLGQHNTKVLIPSVVLAEFLMGIPSDRHAAVAAYLQNSFIVAPFDASAALAFAQIWQENKQASVYQTLRDEGVSRREIKVDCQIVAITLAARASIIYTHDPHLAKFAGNRIEISEVPEIPTQLELDLREATDDDKDLF